ncbi:MAG: glucose-6-phosphate isomerase [Oscillospiraceae bacterium]|nr:glucose-6-phosphate isomerase [Oscillospiraceae bacterium]
MSLKLNAEYLRQFITESEYENFESPTITAAKRLQEDTEKCSQPVGWVDLPKTFDREEFARIKSAAEKIKKICEVFVVIGIGGSYLGARAAIEFIKGENHNVFSGESPEIYFTGNSIDSDSIYELLEICKNKEIAINVISKSGTTTEPAIAFRIFRELLENKYGKDGAKERIYITTDKKVVPGTLKEFAENAGYETFIVPDDIGGRYSVLSAVGLLPIAVAGCDIDQIMRGALDACKDFDNFDYASNDCLKYAAIRNILYSKGKSIEIYCAYSMSFRYIAEWLKQLFAESEGKDNKGIFPASLIYTTDLHSLGQYVQDGKRILFETVILTNKPRHDISIPKAENDIDGLDYISGRSLSYVNSKAFLGTVQAHCSGGVPNIIMELDCADEMNFGYMTYFFEKACAISGYILGINPFNQPGVEEYKRNMFIHLGKPGYEHK